MQLTVKNWPIFTKFLVGVLPFVILLGFAIGYLGFQRASDLRQEISGKRIQTLLEVFEYAFERQVDILNSKALQLSQAREFSFVRDMSKHESLIEYFVDAHANQQVDFSFYYHEGKIVAKGHDLIYSLSDSNPSSLGDLLFQTLTKEGQVSLSENEQKWDMISVSKSDLIKEIGNEGNHWINEASDNKLTVMFTSSETLDHYGIVIAGIVLRPDLPFIRFLKKAARIDDTQYNSLTLYKHNRRVLMVGADAPADVPHIRSKRLAKTLNGVEFQVFLDLSRDNQSQTNFLMRGGGFLGLATILLSVIIFTIAYQLVKPISHLILTSESLAAGDLDIPIETGRFDQIGQLLRAFAAMRDAIKTQIQTIEEHSEGLEIKVEQRTKELQTKHEDIINILSNIHQGILTITEGGMIHPEYSPYLETILEKSDLAGKSIQEVLLTMSDLGADDQDRNLSIIIAIIGSQKVAFQLNWKFLVSEMVIHAPSGNKILELQWSPIVASESSIIDKIILSIKDVTQLRKLKEQEVKHQEEINLITEILGVKRSMFLRFIEGAQSLIADALERIDGDTDDLESSNVESVFLDVHSIKGNARSLNLSHMVETTHSAEKILEEIMVLRDYRKSRLLPEVVKVKETVERYHKIYHQSLAEGQDGGESASYIAEFVEGQLEMIDQTIREMTYTECLFFLEQLSAISKGHGVTFSQSIESIVRSVPSIAHELGKLEPNVVISGGMTFIPKVVQSTIEFSLTHIVRNSLDHGLEASEVRLEKDKSPSGMINIEARRDGKNLFIEVRDDGGGLNLSAILKQATQAGLAAEDKKYTREEIAEFIFEPRFSTTDLVTKISGRGLGMNAVKSAIEKKLGTVEIQLLDGKSEDDSSNAPFKFILSLASIYDEDDRKEAS